MREIFNTTTPGEETNKRLAGFLKDCAIGQKRNRDANKELTKIAPLYDTHDFWDSQPVPKETDTVTAADFDKQIDEVKTVDDISADPLPIPEGFYWSVVNIEDDTECKEVYDLLT